MTDHRTPGTPLGWRVAAALGTLYLVWGSTYLGIRFAIETIPPLLMAGVRFLVAGALLYPWVRLRGAPRPTRSHWVAAAVVGLLLLLGGNGGVTWAEQVLPSGVAALLVGTVPLWMALFEWLRPGGVRPGPALLVGLLCGFAGVALLVGPGELAGGRGIDPGSAAVILVAAVCWAAGSLYSRTGRMPDSPLLGTAMQMLAGGAMLLVAGTLHGEWAQVHPQDISARSALALIYLVLIGAIVGFSVYIWLLRTASAALVSTYAYVNPMVAVFLGWAFAGEPITARTLLAAAVIVAGVVVITSFQARARRRAAPVPTPADVAGVDGEPSAPHPVAR